jgi:hypothetical protein
MHMKYRRIIVLASAVLLVSISITIAIILYGKQQEQKPEITVASSISEIQPETTIANQSLTEIYNEGYPSTFTSVDVLLKISDCVFIGTVSSVSTVRINRADYNLPAPAGFEYSNVTTSYFIVEEVISGDLKVGDSVQVTQYGGEAEGVNDVWENVTYPVEGKQYLVFMQSVSDMGGEKHFENIFAGSFDGFYEIDGAKLIPQDDRAIFIEGESLENALETTKAAIEAVQSNN